MSSDDSDLEDHDKVVQRLSHWNNWTPANKTDDADIIPETPDVNCQDLTPRRKTNSFLRLGQFSRFKKWLPPSSLTNTNVRHELRLLRMSQNITSSTPKTNSLQNSKLGNKSTSETPTLESDNTMFLEIGQFEESSENIKFTINEDWGKRTELHNVLSVREGEKLWNVLDRGVFGEIRLWRNEYGHIACRASGKITSCDSEEKSVVEINTEENLRKLLNLSQMQWSALCESIQMNCALQFSAFETVDLDKMSSLEKLWYFICKRRHLLPCVSIMGKLSGAIKLIQEFSVLPKIVVTDIRDYRGEEIP